MKNLSFWSALLAAGALLPACNSGDTKSDTARQERDGSPSTVQPVILPNPNIPGFSFPDTVNIDGWVQNQDTARIYLHGWGLWTALTANTSYQHNGDTLRVFQTWYNKHEVDSMQRVTGAESKGRMLASSARQLNHQFDSPRQFGRDPKRRALRAAHAMSVGDSNSVVLEQVNYNPSAAGSIVQGKLFWQSTLRKRLQGGQTDLPDFTTDAVVVKPMYEVVPGPQTSQGLYKMKVWTGTPTATPPDANGYDQPKWAASVYVDINNQGQGKGQVSTKGAAATPATTYNLRDFIHYRLNASEAAVLNAAQQNKGARIAHANDYVILVGMHITTNEIANWTWQTLWWSPNPDQVYAPSSAGVVAARPPQLTGAPRHYAMSIGYQMMQPAKPSVVVLSGIPVGKSLYVFNPYLEAPFTSSTFGPPSAMVLTKGLVVNNNYGIRTNCMSCHQAAAYNPVNPTPYMGDTYLDTTNAIFKGSLRTDFLWSIPDMATSPPNSDR